MFIAAVFTFKEPLAIHKEKRGGAVESAQEYLDVSCNLHFNWCQVDERGYEMEIFRYYWKWLELCVSMLLLMTTFILYHIMEENI